jgi:acyl-CoA hydrolase
VTVFQLLPLRRAAYFDPDTTEHVRHTSAFLGGPSRPAVNEGWADYYPAHFSEIPELIRRGLLPSEVVFAHASAMDEHGFFALGLSADYTMAAISRARAVVLEVNPQVPFCFGDCHVHISQVTALVECDEPLAVLPPSTIGPVELAIGGFVADLIPDGATLQIGIGGIPDAVVQQLATKNDLGVHSEMFGDGILALLEAGVVTNQRKNLHRGKMLATFALGSHRLYQYMHRNPALEMHPVDVTNDPLLAGQNDHLHSINGTLQVDLIGQCGSESLGYRPYSGTGGQVDFIRAANRSQGGKAIIVVPSTAKNGTVSCIVPILTAGTQVTTGKNDVNYVVTEYGVAQLRGRTARDRARALVAIAHPDFRAELSEAAARMCLA